MKEWKILLGSVYREPGKHQLWQCILYLALRMKQYIMMMTAQIIMNSYNYFDIFHMFACFECQGRQYLLSTSMPERFNNNWIVGWKIQLLNIDQIWSNLPALELWREHLRGSNSNESKVAQTLSTLNTGQNKALTWNFHYLDLRIEEEAILIRSCWWDKMKMFSASLFTVNCYLMYIIIVNVPKSLLSKDNIY